MDETRIRYLTGILQDNLCSHNPKCDAVEEIRKAARINPKDEKIISAVPVLVEMLGDTNRAVRHEVLLALREIKDPSTASALIEVLNDPDEVVRVWAKQGLRSIGRFALVALIEVMYDKDRKIRLEAREIIQGIFEDSNSVESLNELKAELIKVYKKLSKRRLERNDAASIFRMELFNFMIHIAEKKNQLAPKRDIILDDIPKPPKRGTIYQTARRSIYG